MTNSKLRLTASTLVLGLSAIGCAPVANGPVNSFAATAPLSGPEKLYARTQVAIQAGEAGEALSLAERLVEQSPRDVGYRTLLGDLYLKNGRFASAETTFSDVLTLDPDNARASLSLALALTAQGKTMLATAELDRIADKAAPGDIGLAYALAGQPARAIQLLEPASRAPEADGRVRQNLALAYAIAGDWAKARVAAAQDVSPADLAGRLASWADLSNPGSEGMRVSRLLGVTPVADPGQPIRLALAVDTLDESQFAAVAAEPMTSQVAQLIPAAKPVEVAHYPAPVEAAPVELRLAAAAQSLVKAEPAVLKGPVKLASIPGPVFKPAKAATLEAPVKVGQGRFVVQIGAYQSQAVAQAAWGRALRRFQLGGDLKPHSTTVSVPGKGFFHRLSIAGFEAHVDAARLCRSIRVKGGACFVRTRAGDAIAAWAAKGAGRG
jgi:tetratricopeptide (TPR) repeat protein